MKKTCWLVLAPLIALAATAWAAEQASVPADPIGQKKEVLFADDFNRTELTKPWKVVVPTYVIEDGALKGTQTRVNAPAANGKPAVSGHQAVAGVDVPTRDSVVQFRFRFAGATGMSVEFDDRKFTGSHYGHICFARITPRSVVLADQRDGSMRNDIYEMSKDPKRKAEHDKLLKGRSASFPVTFDLKAWHTFELETVGDAMRATLDDKPVAYLKSSGIAHPTKSRIEFGCAGKDGYFDDIKVWNAEPIKH